MANYPWEKSYPPGVKWELEIPKKPLHQIFEDSCAQFGDRPFTDFLDKVMSFRDYKEASDKAAAGFQKLGVKPGVNVGLYLPNTPHYIIAFFGVLKAGGRVVNYSPLDAARELEFKISCLGVVFTRVRGWLRYHAETMERLRSDKDARVQVQNLVGQNVDVIGDQFSLQFNAGIAAYF